MSVMQNRLSQDLNVIFQSANQAYYDM